MSGQNTGTAAPTPSEGNCGVTSLDVNWPHPLLPLFPGSVDPTDSQGILTFEVSKRTPTNPTRTYRGIRIDHLRISVIMNSQSNFRGPVLPDFSISPTCVPVIKAVGPTPQAELYRRSLLRFYRPHTAVLLQKSPNKIQGDARARRCGLCSSLLR